MLVGITAQKIKHSSYNEIGYYVNEKWQLLSKIIGIKLVILTSLDMTEELINNKTIGAIILSEVAIYQLLFLKVIILLRSEIALTSKEKKLKKIF